MFIHLDDVENANILDEEQLIRLTMDLSDKSIANLRPDLD